jgi:predicted enzyme related to lactoylglutathione lyase
MSIITSPWPAGVPCWTDLSAPDVPAAQAFYADVLGWTYQETGEEYGGYVTAEVNGALAAGIGPAQEGAPPAWTLYIASDDADKTAASVAEHGGTVLAPPFDVGTVGRMFVAADPTGATFGVWQAGTHLGAGIVNAPGGLAWEDLRSTDPDAARAFYTAVFSYRTFPLPAAGPDYTIFSLSDDDRPLGGLGGMMGTEGQPSHWLVYFGVADTGAAVEAVELGGGSVLKEAFETPYGRMAGVADPSGAVFWLTESKG